MSNNKVTLTTDLKEFISSVRKENNLKLIDLAAKSKGSKYEHDVAWYSQIEGKRTKTIKLEELINIFMMILDASYDYAKKYIEDFLSGNNKVNVVNENASVRIFKIEDEDDEEMNLRHLEDAVETLKNISYQFYNHMNNKKEATTMLQVFSCNILMDIGFMISLNCLNWDRLENTDDDVKHKILQEINLLIQKYGSLSSIDKSLTEILPNFNPEIDRPDFTK